MSSSTCSNGKLDKLYFFCILLPIIFAIYYLKFSGNKIGKTDGIVWPLTSLAYLWGILGFADSRGLWNANYVPKPYFKRGLTFIGLLTLSIGSYFSPAAKQMWADFAPLRPALTFEPFGDFSREIFPSIELGFAHLNEKAVEQLVVDEPDEAKVYRQRPQGSTIGVILHEVRKGDHYSLKVYSDGATSDSTENPVRQLGLIRSNTKDLEQILKPSSYSFKAEADSSFALAYPELIFNFNALTRINQTQPINLTFELSRNGGSPLITTQVWQLRQLRDCPIGMRSQTVTKTGKIKEEVMNTTFFFSAYVNENHPLVERIITEAIGTGKVASFSGYQAGRASVLRQMEAIWAALEARNIRYSSITATTGSESFVQHVRLIEDTLRTSQANCVDGSILYASIARKVGLNPVLVITPGHCYVAIDYDNDLIALEMTMLGRRSFQDAVGWATHQSPNSITKNLIKFTRPSKNQRHFLIPIKECREFGIQPIPYSGK
jgi:hypothetical protein